MDKGEGVGKSGAEGATGVRLCTLGAQSAGTTPRRVQAGSRETSDGEGNRTVGDSLLQGIQEPVACHRTSTRSSSPDAGERQVARLLSGDDLCGFSGGSELRDWEPGCASVSPHSAD